MQQPGSQAGGQRGPQPAAAADEDTPFAVQAATIDASADDRHPQPPITVFDDAGPLDADAAAIAAEAADDVSALPDTAARSGSSADAAAKVKGATAAPAPAAPMVNNAASSKHKHRRKMIPLKRVMRDTYEYHGLNDLFWFCITALSVTLVLYWHWGETTATFKATVQSSFQSYGNPDWQSQSFSNVETMFDAVEYSVGWLEFWLQRANTVEWPNNTMRLGEFADVKYARMLVNLDRNCELNSANMLCYKNDDLSKALQKGTYSENGEGFDNLLDWAGWTQVGQLVGRDSQDAGPNANNWWAYPIIAPKYDGKPTTMDDYIGRMYNITRATNLNYNDCDWAAYTCANVGPFTPKASGPKCAQVGQQVPFQDWWSKEEMCANATIKDELPANTRALQRGQRFFARHPQANLRKPLDGGNVVNLKPFLTKYAYSIALDVLAANAASQPAGKKESKNESDMALFSMIVQRSAITKEQPDRLMWQITTTLPVRTGFYSQTTDLTRITFEVSMHICIFVVLSFQVWQITVCYRQHGSFKPWVKHIWNCFELLSNITLLAWVLFYWVLFGTLFSERNQWIMDNWDMQNEQDTARHINRLTRWSGYYSVWLYMGIIVDFLICLRLTRYMRIHVGLKAFYQVFIIAAREFLDFAVFLFYILVLLGSAVFAFFQLTGGNTQFLRFPDGLSLMSRLTFGFLSYEDFQSQALGVGAAVSAVTGLFWVAVLLLVVYTQNIILAIVAEAYEEAKAKLGTAKTSFLMLVLMRILFTTLFVIYRIRMLCRDILYACTGWGRLKQIRPPSFKRTGSVCDSTNYLAGGPDKHGPNDGGSAIGNKSMNGQGMQSDDDCNPSVFGDDQGLVLASTASRAVLPFDVEEGLASSYTSGRPGNNSQVNRNGSRMTLLGGNRRSSSQSRDNAPAAGEVPGVMSRIARGMSSMGGRSVKGDEPQSLGQRLSGIWHDVILGERHMLRMYSDVYLAPGESSTSWVTKWKTTYWRPWCVARTAPLRCLMNLYQDFASYKLKQECTWMANNKAKEVMGKYWHGEGQTGSITSQASGGSSSGSAPKDALAAAVSSACDDACTAWSMPQLADDMWVSEDELARLFLVTSNMLGVLKIWHSPFKKLTSKEVGYLVKGIAEVYGRDEEDWLQERRQVLADSGSDDGSMKDARLGGGPARKSGGGFFSGLNQKRRDGGVEQGKQVTLLLHTNKRLEDATHKTAAQLSSTTASLKLQMNAQQSFQRKQQETNAQLLRGLHDLHDLMLMQQHHAGHATASGAQFGGASGVSTSDRGTSGAGGVASPRPGSSSHATTSKRFNSVAAATSKIFGGKNKAHSSGDQAQLALGGDGGAGVFPAHPMRTTSNVSARSGGYDPDALEQLAEEDDAAGQPAATDNAALVLTLQQQLEQQQKALQAQQELLLQVLARLPAPQP